MDFCMGKNYVGELQEHCSKFPALGLPLYNELGMTGLTNNPTFKMSCKLGDIYVIKEYQGKKAILKQQLAFDVQEILGKRNESVAVATNHLTEIQNIPAPVTDGSVPNGPVPLSTSNSIQNKADYGTKSNAGPILSGFTETPDLSGMHEHVNYAAMLIDLCRHQQLSAPTFIELNKSGPPHNPKFRMECQVAQFSLQLEMESNKKVIQRCLNYLMYSKLKEIENGGKPVESGTCNTNGSPVKKPKLSVTETDTAGMQFQFSEMMKSQATGNNEERSRAEKHLSGSSGRVSPMDILPAPQLSVNEQVGIGKDGQFSGMDPNENYAGLINMYCQKNSLILEFKELQRTGPANNPKFLLQGSLARQTDSKIIHCTELEMRANLKTIKRHLAFLLLKKLDTSDGEYENDLEPDMKKVTEDVQQQLDEAHAIRETLMKNKPKSSPNQKPKRAAPAKEVTFKGVHAYTVLNNFRMGITTKTSIQLVDEIIHDEIKYGPVSRKAIFMTKKAPFQCMFIVKLHESSITFPGTGPSRADAENDGATQALKFLNQIMMPKCEN